MSLALDVVILWRNLYNFSHVAGGEARASVLAKAACPVQSSSFGSHDRQSSAGDIVLMAEDETWTPENSGFRQQIWGFILG